MATAVRICRLHNKTCTEDLRRDAVICPVGDHRVKQGAWYTAAAADGDENPEVLVQRQALRAIARANKDRPGAVAALVDEAEKNLPLRNALLLPYLHDAARAAIARSLGLEADEPELLGPGGRTHLGGAKDRPTEQRPPRSHGDRGLQLVGDFNMRNLLSFRLPAGYELREATRNQVLDAAEEYFKTARDGAMRGRWLKLVADRLVNGTARVRQVLSERELGAMYGRAESEVRQLGEQLHARTPLPAVKEATS